MVHYQKHHMMQQKTKRKRFKLPEYLLPEEVAALLKAAPHPVARLLVVFLWRAGLRISEALGREVSDVELEGEKPTVRVRQGKGGKDRLVPVHPELVDVLRNALAYGSLTRGRLFKVSRTTAWRWVKEAQAKAEEMGLLPPGRRIGTHTLRHSAARHWLASGIPINVVSRWLGHSNLRTTLIYLEILPDPVGWMGKVS